MHGAVAVAVQFMKYAVHVVVCIYRMCQESNYPSQMSLVASLCSCPTPVKNSKVSNSREMSSSEAAPVTEQQQQQQQVAAETMLPAGTASEVPAKGSEVKQVQPAGSKGGSGASKDTQQPTAAASIVETVKRFIPGLGGSAAPAAEASKPKRSRGAKKGKQDVNLKTSNDAAHDAATLESAPSRDQVPDSLQANLASTNNVKGSKPTSLSLLNGGSSSTPGGGGEDGSLTASEQALLDSKRSFSPSSIVQKRLKANNKKLQRISGYENQVEALNADQKKAVAGKPALEAVQRELGELSKVFEEEEKEEDKNGEKRKQIEQRLARYRTEQAVKKANVSCRERAKELEGVSGANEHACEQIAAAYRHVLRRGYMPAGGRSSSLEVQ